MGEARRRANDGLPPRKKKTKDGQGIMDTSPRIISWLPITESQKNKFFELTIRGGWIGIALLVLLWIIVRIIGPAAGWWIPADLH